MENVVVKCENSDLFKIIKIICWILHEKYMYVYCVVFIRVAFSYQTIFVFLQRDTVQSIQHTEHCFRFNENFSAAMTTNWHCRWFLFASIDVTVIVAFVCNFIFCVVIICKFLALHDFNQIGCSMAQTLCKD